MGSLILSTLALAGVATAGFLTIMPAHPGTEADGIGWTSLMAPINASQSIKRLPDMTSTEIVSAKTFTNAMPANPAATQLASKQPTTMTRVTVPVTSSLKSHTSNIMRSQHEPEAITRTITIMNSAFPKHKHHDATEIIIVSAPDFTLQTVTTRHASKSAPTQSFTNSSVAAITQQSTMTTMTSHSLPSPTSSSSISAVKESGSRRSTQLSTMTTMSTHNLFSSTLSSSDSVMRASPSPKPDAPTACLPLSPRDFMLLEVSATAQELISSMEGGDQQLGNTILAKIMSLYSKATDAFCRDVVTMGGDGDGENKQDDLKVVLQRAKVAVSGSEVKLCEKDPNSNAVCEILTVVQDLEKLFQTLHKKE